MFATLEFCSRTHFLFSLIPRFHLFFSFFFCPFRTYPPVMEPTCNGEAASRVHSENNFAVLLRFVEAIEATDFGAHFNINRPYAKQSLKWIMFSNTVLAKKDADLMRLKEIARLNPSKSLIFASFPDLISLGDSQRTSSADIAVISWCCDVCREKPSRARNLLFAFSRGTEFCDTNQWRSIFGTVSTLSSEASLLHCTFQPQQFPKSKYFQALAMAVKAI